MSVTLTIRQDVKEDLGLRSKLARHAAAIPNQALKGRAIPKTSKNATYKHGSKAAT